MQRILVWTDKRGWLSNATYPEVHRRFTVTPYDGSRATSEPSALLLVDDTILRSRPDEVRRVAQNSRPFTLPVIAVGRGHADDDSDLDDLVYDVLSVEPKERDVLRAIRNAVSYVDAEKRLRESQAAAEQWARQLEELNAIGVALSAERDHEKLLNLILSKSREITQADAGSLCLVEGIEAPIGREDRKGDQARVKGRWLRFRLAQNDSVEFKFEEQVLAITSESIAGYVALSGDLLNIDDAYALPPDTPFTINRSIDETTGYQSHSMLVVPMQNREGETIGVLQLINKKTDASLRLCTPESFNANVLPFTANDAELVSSLASQAAISVENNALYQQIEKLFDDFVEASVMAIESRDPVTRGHSRRVARMTVELARVTSRTETGPYRSLRLSEDEIRELKYAALLHDFGKVGVKEKVLQKGNKLLFGELEQVKERFNTIRRTLEVQHLRRLLDRLMRREDVSEEELRALEKDLEQELLDVDRGWEAVLAANQPTVTSASVDSALLDALGTRFIESPDGRSHPFLKRGELLALKVPRGTLTASEREEVQMHVVHTYEFLAKIPWTRDLQNIPKLARGHHEKLDGSGYPFRLVAEEIPPQTRMMTIADIFDALAAQDRPYKPRVPTDRALDILREEAREGKLDTDLLDLFVEAKVFRLIE